MPQTIRVFLQLCAASFFAVALNACGGGSNSGDSAARASTGGSSSTPPAQNTGNTGGTPATGVPDGFLQDGDVGDGFNHCHITATDLTTNKVVDEYDLAATRDVQNNDLATILTKDTPPQTEISCGGIQDRNGDPATTRQTAFTFMVPGALTDNVPVNATDADTGVALTYAYGDYTEQGGNKWVCLMGKQGPNQTDSYPKAGTFTVSIPDAIATKDPSLFTQVYQFHATGSFTCPQELGNTSSTPSVRIDFTYHP